MVTLRCTRKLLRRLAVNPPQSDQRATSALGDWHANLLLWRPQLIHCMNDRSTLSVLMPARDSTSFPSRLGIALGQLLLELGVPRKIVEAEVASMEQVTLAPTKNRSILGCMRDAELALRYAAESGRHSSIEGLQMHLTEHIHQPTGYRQPGELAFELLTTSAH